MLGRGREAIGIHALLPLGSGFDLGVCLGSGSILGEHVGLILKTGQLPMGLLVCR